MKLLEAVSDGKLDFAPVSSRFLSGRERRVLRRRGAGGAALLLLL